MEIEMEKGRKKVPQKFETACLSKHRKISFQIKRSLQGTYLAFIVRILGLAITLWP